MTMRNTLVALTVATTLCACGGDKSTAPTPAALVVDSINPTRGTVGTVVRVMGSGFTDSTRVFFNATLSSLVTHQGNQLFATAPDGLTLGSTYSVRVVNLDGGRDSLA